ncbi:PH domain-containing protein [Chloroflexota bacterium]
MNYSKNVLLYQDEPVYGLFIKLIIMVIPVVMLVGSIYLFSSENNADGLALLLELIIIGLIFWVVFPRRYQVYEDHLRIVLGGPFSVRVGFDKIKAIGVTSRQILSINFITKLTKNYVEIAKKRGLSIAITPGDNDLFVENANRALSQWVKTN